MGYVSLAILLTFIVLAGSLISWMNWNDKVTSARYKQEREARLDDYNRLSRISTAQWQLHEIKSGNKKPFELPF